MKTVRVCILLSVLTLCAALVNKPLNAQVIGGLEFTVGKVPSATLPLDVALKHTFIVRNITSAENIYDLRTRVVETNQEAPTFPQPPTLYFSPGEEIPVTIILDGATGRLNELPVGTHTRSVEFTFKNHNNQTDSSRITISYTITVLNRSSISGSLLITGTALDNSGAPVANAQINLDTGTDFSLPTGSSANGGFSYSVPPHSKWMLKASKLGYSDAYAFVDTNFSGPYQLKLLPAPPQSAQFQATKTVNVDFGFWQGAVTADEQKVLLTQGMEIWPNESLRPQAKLMLYQTDGTALWQYPMGYDSWGTSISSDGALATYAQKHSTQPEIGLVDATTGTLIWKRTLNIQNFMTGSFFIGHSSNEIRISHTKQYMSLGTGEGDFYLLNRADGQIIWRKFVKGQVRNTQFSPDDQFMYVGSDPWLYKFRISDSSLVWRANIFSWPLHYGLRLSPDGTLIAAMGKSGDVTVVRTSDGGIQWSFNQGVIGQWLDFSPDGKYLAAAAFGGTWVYDVATGKQLWRARGTKAGYFSADNKHLLLFNELYTNQGARIAMLPEPVGGQFCFINKEGTHIVLASGQMNDPGIGMVFYQGSIVSDVEQLNSEIPKTFCLSQNYPNPLNPSTTISFAIPSRSFVSLKVFDALGREVSILLADELSPGTYARRWNADGLSSGIYFYQLQAGVFTQTKKLILLR